MSNDQHTPNDPGTGDPRLIRPFRVQDQGHMHVELVSTTDRRPGVRGWYIQTEQKRPDAFANEYGREVAVVLHSREDGTIHLRDGEDGSESTTLLVWLPRPWLGRYWRVETINDKWGVELICWTSWFPGRSPWQRLTRWFETATYRAKRSLTRTGPTTQNLTGGVPA